MQVTDAMWQVEVGDDGNMPWMERKTASPKVVKMVLEAAETSEDGRSQWVWLRLPNGDLVLAVYPQGDIYFNTEMDPGRP